VGSSLQQTRGRALTAGNGCFHAPEHEDIASQLHARLTTNRIPALPVLVWVISTVLMGWKPCKKGVCV
jgi:hypothetical protein